MCLDFRKQNASEGDRYTYYLDCGDGFRVHPYVKMDHMIHFKCVQLVVCQACLNKTFFKKE